MIDVQQAVQSAKSFALGVYPPSELRDLRVEEVDLADDGRTWEITLGWSDPAQASGTALAFLGQSGPRIYKTFRIDAETGNARSMKIRSVR